MKKILIKLFLVSIFSVLVPFFLIGLISGLVFDVTKYSFGQGLALCCMSVVLFALSAIIELFYFLENNDKN